MGTIQPIKEMGLKTPKRISSNPNSQLLRIQFSSICSAPAEDEIVFVSVFGAQRGKEVTMEMKDAIR